MGDEEISSGGRMWLGSRLRRGAKFGSDQYILWRCLVMWVNFAAVSVPMNLDAGMDGVSLCQRCAF